MGSVEDLRSRLLVLSRSPLFHYIISCILVCDIGLIFTEVGIMVRYPHGHNCTEIPEHIEHAEQGLHWATIALLALLNLEWAFLLFVNGIRQFFKHWEFVLDMILVSTAMILTVLFHELELNPAAETIAELLLLILRLLRLMHAIFTIVEEEKDEEIKRLENRIRDLEGKLKQI